LEKPNRVRIFKYINDKKYDDMNVPVIEFLFSALTWAAIVIYPIRFICWILFK